MNNKYKLKTLFWEATLRCNARCAFCGSGCGEIQSYPDELTGDEICSALLDISGKLDPSEIMLNITGGEPLARADVLEVAAYASELGFSWGMVTNGSLIDEKKTARMKSAGMKTLTVSIDGCRETHEKLRRLDGSFDRIINTLREISSQGFAEHLQVTTVVNNQNIHELEDLREILLGIGLNSWRVVTVDPIGRALSNQSILLDKEGMKRYFEFTEKYKADSKLPVIQSCSHYFGEWEHRLRTRCFDCGAGKKVASILYNGDIFVCPNVERRKELIQGNVRTDSLADKWINGFDFFRSRKRTVSGQCRGCYYKESCLGDSLHTWNFDEERPMFCIKDYYSTEQINIYSRKEQLYNAALSRLKAECSDASVLKISCDKPSECRVFFERSAAKQLFSYFEWGRNTRNNEIEQMACLIGREECGMFVISHISPVFIDLADRESAVFTKETLLSAEKALRELKENDNRLELIGFVHSHPHELETVLSVGDAELHRRLTEKKNIKLSMLVNPHKKRINAYFGECFELAEIYIAGSAQELEKTEISVWEK